MLSQKFSCIGYVLQYEGSDKPVRLFADRVQRGKISTEDEGSRDDHLSETCFVGIFVICALEKQL